MATMNFGGVSEQVVTREEFSLDRAKDVLKDTHLEELLLNNIITSNNEQLDIDIFDWELYLNITHNKFNINPKNLLLHKLFNKFKVKKKSVKKQQIYPVLF